MLRVLHNQDAINTRTLRTLLRVGQPFHDPEAATLVEAHRDWLDDLRLGRDQRDLEAWGKGHRLHRLGRSLTCLISGRRDVLGRTGRHGGLS